MKLFDEQRFLQRANEARKIENEFLKKQRNDQIRDLRETYKRQQEEKRERERTFMKEWKQNKM